MPPAQSRIQVTRVALGGLVASVVLFVITGAVNAGLLSGEFAAWSRSMGELIHPPTPSTSMLLWTLMSLIYGFVGVWLYAALRPRFGAGPKTALVAALSLWLVSKLATALDLVALGVLPGRLIAGQLVASLVAMAAAIVAGAALYREPSRPDREG